MSCPRMSSAEIRALDLKAGERVRIIWKGGNRPYEYTLTEREGALFAQDKWDVENDHLDTMKRIFWMQHVERVEEVK